MSQFFTHYLYFPTPYSAPKPPPHTHTYKWLWVKKARFSFYNPFKMNTVNLAKYSDINAWAAMAYNENRIKMCEYFIHVHIHMILMCIWKESYVLSCVHYFIFTQHSILENVATVLFQQKRFCICFCLKSHCEDICIRTAWVPDCKVTFFVMHHAVLVHACWNIS